MRRVAQGLRDTAKRLMARDRAAALALQHRAAELLNMAKEEENRVLRLLERSPPPMMPGRVVDEVVMSLLDRDRVRGSGR